MTTSRSDLKKIADLLHTIYCGLPHEMEMEKFNTSKKCKYYLEDTIDRTWELDEHKEWLKQAQCLVSVSHPLEVTEVLGDIVKIYQIAEKLRKVNPKLFSYILMLIK